MKKFLSTYTSDDGAGVFAVMWVVIAVCAISYLLAGTI
jgi:hypothetical protein